MVLLTSRDGGRRFGGGGPGCLADQPRAPMSTTSIVEGGSRGRPGRLGDPKRAGLLRFRGSTASPGRADDSGNVSPGRTGIAGSIPCWRSTGEGRCLLVWTEGTAWAKGRGRSPGRSSTSRAVRSGRRGEIAGGVPVWGLATVVARPDGEVHDHPLIGRIRPASLRSIRSKRPRPGRRLNATVWRADWACRLAFRLRLAPSVRSRSDAGVLTSFWRPG